MLNLHGFTQRNFKYCSFSLWDYTQPAVLYHPNYFAKFYLLPQFYRKKALQRSDPGLSLKQRMQHLCGHVSLNNFTFRECMYKRMSSAGTGVTNLEVAGEESWLFDVCIQLSAKRVVSSCMLMIVLCGIIYIN